MQGGISVNALSARDAASEWHGIDADADLVRQHPDLPIIQLDLNLPIQTALPPVDFVVMTEVLEHLQAPVTTLRNLGCLLPGVRLIGSVPNALSVGRVVTALWNPDRYDVFDGHHLMVFNRYTLWKTLTAAGLSDLDTCVYDCHAIVRPFLKWRPDFARGLYFEGVF